MGDKEGTRDDERMGDNTGERGGGERGWDWRLGDKGEGKGGGSGAISLALALTPFGGVLGEGLPDVGLTKPVDGSQVDNCWAECAVSWPRGRSSKDEVPRLWKKTKTRELEAIASSVDKVKNLRSLGRGKGSNCPGFSGLLGGAGDVGCRAVIGG